MNYQKKIAKTMDPAVLERLAARLVDPDAAAAALQRAADLRAGAIPVSNQQGK